MLSVLFRGRCTVEVQKAPTSRRMTSGFISILLVTVICLSKRVVGRFPEGIKNRLGFDQNKQIILFYTGKNSPLVMALQTNDLNVYEMLEFRSEMENCFE